MLRARLQVMRQYSMLAKSRLIRHEQPNISPRRLDLSLTTNASSTLSKLNEKPTRSSERVHHIALIGLGHRGYGTHFLSLLDSPSDSIVAVCDTDCAALKSFSVKHPTIPTYYSLTSLLQNHKPDFAIVCVPHKFHMSCIHTLSQAGIPVLKEKPIASSLREFNQMIDLPIKIGVAFQRRFETRFEEFKKLLPVVGDIGAFRANLSMNIGALDSTWRAADNVGVTEDLGCHMLDLIAWFFGVPSSLTGHRVTSIRPFQKYGGDDISNIIMDWSRPNLIGHVHLSRVAHEPVESITVTGTKGTILLDGRRVVHLDVNGLEVLQSVDTSTEKSVIRSMVREFGKYVTGCTNDYPASLANVRDTVSISEAAKMSFIAHQVQNPLHTPKKTPSMLIGGKFCWSPIIPDSNKIAEQMTLLRPIISNKKFNLNSGDKIPAVGLGTRKCQQPEDVREAVKTAVLRGYRHIDTAQSYCNEHEVSQGIKDSGVSRNDIWITTKLDNAWHSRVDEAIDRSLKALDMDYVDLYLMHWPASTDPNDPNKHIPDWDFVQTWQAMQKLSSSGRVKNIGVSNFGIRNLTKLLNHPSCNIIPAVNQIELHPYWPSPKLLEYCRGKGIHCTAYSSLGSYNSPLLRDPTLLNLAEKKGKTPQQILIMWGLQRGTSVIPKSITASRIASNFDLDGWELTDEEINMLSSLNSRFKACSDSWLPVRVFFDDENDE